MLKIGVDTNRYSDRNRHSQTEQTLGMLLYGQTDAVLSQLQSTREHKLDYSRIPLDSPGYLLGDAANRCEI